jgi:hypothetical protein
MKTIKEQCEACYLQIKQAHEELTRLRSICKHTNTFEGNYSWRPGCIEPVTICSDCDEVIKVHRPEFIQPEYTLTTAPTDVEIKKKIK